MTRTIVVISILLAIGHLPVMATEPMQENVSRPIVSTYSLELGGGESTDTYLSPLRYKGFHMGLSGDWSKALPFGTDLSMTMRGRIEWMHLNNPAGNAEEWQGAVGFDWLMRRGWRLTERLTLSGGGGMGLYAGCLYMPRNSNNPAAAKAYVSVEATAALSYRLQIGSLPVTLRDEVVTPVAGIFFNQGYTQPYYDIYLGNRDGLLHAGWWGNNFCIDNLIGGRLQFSRGELGIGYRFRFYSSHVNNLDTHLPTHAAVISWSPRRPVCNGKTLNYPLY